MHDLDVSIIKEDEPAYKLRRSVVINFETDRKFWAILPAINYNRHYPQLEIEFLCFAIYMRLEHIYAQK